MPDLSDLVVPTAVAAGVSVTSRKPLVPLAAGIAAAAYALDRTVVAEALAAREKLGSTGFGGGVAIPHAKLAAVERPLGAFLRLEAPVAFGAIDDLPVDLVFVLLSPLAAGADHLKALARVSRALRDKAFVAKLRGAGSADAIYALLAGGEADVG
ncbi:MAG: PTS sugar transporter subunit IIA [Pseudomonadota bacterium]